jgi:hypothetical protein
MESNDAATQFMTDCSHDWSIIMCAKTLLMIEKALVIDDHIQWSLINNYMTVRIDKYDNTYTYYTYSGNHMWQCGNDSLWYDTYLWEKNHGTANSS